MGGSERRNVVISLYLLQNMRFRRSRNFMNKQLKMAFTNYEKLRFGRPWAGNYLFGALLEVSEKKEESEVFEVAKNG